MNLSFPHKRVVVKFGGADLSSGRRVRRAAKMVKEADYKDIVVVVSAMGKTTDSLIEYISGIGKVEDEDYSEIVSMGERTSARIFSLALKSLGLKSTYFDPQQERWPIITDSKFKTATPDLKETKKRVKKNLEPLLGESIPVICGFLGKDRDGHITTLGRGGSDITATLLGNCLQANEVILVKDTQGVLSADPNVVLNAKPFKKLTIKEMFCLAHGGAKIVNPAALQYKLPNQRVRIVSFSSGKLSESGTEILGILKANPMEINSHIGLVALTLIGKMSSKNLSQVFKTLEEKRLFGISTGGESITIFAKVADLKGTVKRLHDLYCFKAISSYENVGVIELINPSFIDSPGWIAEISGVFARNDINILEMTTSKATINVFIDENKIDKALILIGELIET